VPGFSALTPILRKPSEPVADNRCVRAPETCSRRSGRRDAAMDFSTLFGLRNSSVVRISLNESSPHAGISNRKQRSLVVNR